MLPGEIILGQLVCVKNGPRKLYYKFCQNWVSNNIDITDMDECRQEKCYLQCQYDSLDLF